MKRILIVAGLIVLMFGLVIVGTIGSLVKAGAATPPVLTVDATNATLQIPDPACRPEGCQWALYIFKVNPDKSQTPDGQGNAGVGQIQVPLPLNYCGEVQIDYGVIDDSGVFHKDVGHQYQVSTCTTPTTTTTIGCPPNDTPPPCTVPTTTTTVPDGTTTTTAAPPLPSSGGGSAPNHPSVTPQGGEPVPPLAPPVAPIQTVPVLAYTGAPVGWLALLGSVLVASGLLLMRRRAA